MTKQDYLESKGLEIHGHNLLEEVDYEIQDIIEECEDSEVQIMTKGEYCNLKGLHTSFPNFNPNDELTEDFKNAVDTLVDKFEEIYNENEYSEV